MRSSGGAGPSRLSPACSFCSMARSLRTSSGSQWLAMCDVISSSRWVMRPVTPRLSGLKSSCCRAHQSANHSHSRACAAGRADAASASSSPARLNTGTTRCTGTPSNSSLSGTRRSWSLALSRSTLVRTRMVRSHRPGHRCAACRITSKPTSDRTDAVFESTTRRTSVASSSKTRSARSRVHRAVSSGMVTMPGRSMRSRLGTLLARISISSSVLCTTL
mmetsp:Transcript_6504/g.19277  ORF Transcript_6504/g.19277 Transcript_6504/m.19277 type:complete len:219 (+) Transcript_6504:1050-1706(+)